MRSQAVTGGPIPGLQRALMRDDLVQACDYHNNLSDVNENQDRKEHVEFLLGLLGRYGVQDKFGIVDTHEHFHVPYGSHLVAKFGISRGSPFSVIQTVDDETFNPDELCGHKFTYIPKLGLRPYEFRRGPLLGTSEVDPRFFPEFINYLDEHNLTSIGLEYTEPQVSGIKMYELVWKIQRRMILVKLTPSLKLRNQSQWVPTCWRRSSKSNTMSGPEVWCGKDKDTGKHKDPPEDFPVDIYLTSI